MYISFLHLSYFIGNTLYLPINCQLFTIDMETINPLYTYVYSIQMIMFTFSSVLKIISQLLYLKYTKIVSRKKIN